MRFEEALKYFKGGQTIARGRSEEGYSKVCHKTVGDYYITFDDVIADDWEVLKDRPIM